MPGRSGVDVLDPAPPRSGGEHGGRGGWAWLVTAGDVFEAEILKGLLENAGIPVSLDSFDPSPFAWMYPAGNVQRPVKLFVPSGLLEAAKLELLESAAVAPDRIPEPEPAASHRPLMRDRIRPFWLVVAVLTSMAVSLYIITEVLGFAPCATRLLC